MKMSIRFICGYKAYKCLQPELACVDVQHFGGLPIEDSASRTEDRKYLSKTFNRNNRDGMFTIRQEYESNISFNSTHRLYLEKTRYDH
jgi:hypothetical protein